MPYSRPAVVAPRIVDASGASIAFGERWGMGPPPEELYSVDAHPERFAPLHVVADALVAHLTTSFDVATVDAVEEASMLLDGRGPTVLRAARLVPGAADAAPLVVAWSAYPGVLVQAGAAHVGIFPVCGCEACDEPWDRVADHLEALVLAVADGRLQESTDRGIGHTLEAADGSPVSSGWTSTSDEHDQRRRRVAQRILAARDGDRWQPWPARPGTR